MFHSVSFVSLGNLASKNVGCKIGLKKKSEQILSGLYHQSVPHWAALWAAYFCIVYIWEYPPGVSPSFCTVRTEPLVAFLVFILSLCLSVTGNMRDPKQGEVKICDCFRTALG